MHLSKIIWMLLCYLALFVSIGCDNVQDPDTLTSITNDGVLPDVIPGVVPIRFTEKRVTAVASDDYVLNSATITGDTLAINASYGGGCESHEFTLIVSEQFLESHPVQLAVSLVHDGNDDRCEAWLTEDYTCDLTRIKTYYQESYRQDTGTVVLNLGNAPNGQLIYEF